MPMTAKDFILETIQELPADCSVADIAERIDFLAAIEKGLEDLDAGNVIPHEEVKKRMAAWLVE